MLTILMLVRHSDHVVDHQAVVERLVHLGDPPMVSDVCYQLYEKKPKKVLFQQVTLTDVNHSQMIF